MRKHWVVLGIGVAIALSVMATRVVLAPGKRAAPSAVAAPIDNAEQAQTIEALRQRKRERPVIAIVALNEATEVTDLLVPYGVLQRANIADVSVVAERASPVPLHPFSRLGMGPALVSIEPQSTMRAFDDRHPDGADYVVVPAMEPRDNPFVMSWIVAQSRKGAQIVAVCAGAETLGAAGLLDGRRATTHWAYVDDLKKAEPGMQWTPDRRYVSDNGVSTSTGITASMPIMIALVEAIAGRSKAEQLARDLGAADWDARHRSSAFQLTWEHQKTYLRNWLSFWRQEVLGIPVHDGVDEIALALTIDAYSRTALSKVVTVGNGREAIRGKHGLLIHTNMSDQAIAVDDTLPAPDSDAPARTIDKVLTEIASRFDRPTADIVALVMEYPWAGDETR